jgi:hypothetical protein
MFQLAGPAARGVEGRAMPSLRDRKRSASVVDRARRRVERDHPRPPRVIAALHDSQLTLSYSRSLALWP